MVHKKYTYKDGKRFGPYLYETHRINGKIVTRYLGHAKETNYKKYLLPFSFFAFIGVLLLLFLFYADLTGRVSLDIRANYNPGEQITGSLNLNINAGELIPEDSELIVNFNNEEKRFLLSELVDSGLISGNFYAQGTGISGNGEGYGLIGKKEIYPEIDFELRIIDKFEEEAGDSADGEILEENASVDAGEGTSGEVAGEEDEAAEGNLEGGVDEGLAEGGTTTESEGEAGTGEAGTGETGTGETGTGTNEAGTGETGTGEGSGSDAGTSAGDGGDEGGAVSSSDSGTGGGDSGGGDSGGGGESGGDSGAGITGGVISVSGNIVSGRVSKDSAFEYEITENQGAEIISGSVKSEGEEISDSEIKLNVRDNKAEVSTDYFIEEEGFGEDYLTSDKIKISVDIAKLGLIAENNSNLNIKIVYSEEVIVEVGKDISIIEESEEEPTETILNETISNETIADINQTLNETAINETIAINITIETNITINTTQYGAVLGQPVKWSKKIELEKGPATISVEIPASAQNISVKKLDEKENKKEIGEQEVINEEEQETEGQEGESGGERQEEITGNGEITEFENETQITDESNVENETAAIENAQGNTEGINAENLPEGLPEEINIDISGSVVFGRVTADIQLEKESKIIKFFKRIFRLTGRATSEDEKAREIIVNLNETEDAVEIEYYTDAPSISFEEERENGKRIQIASPDDVHYENVLIFTELNETLGIESADDVRIKWEENESYLPILNIIDKNNNSIYDYIEFVAPRLSNQTFNIIVITNAEHLDENRTFISDIYPDVKELDGNWSETISDGHYVRVTFERNLTSENDITIYPRIVSGTPRIEVYEVDESKIIAEFVGLRDNEYNEVFLTGLAREQDTFDLRILNGSVEFDHIIDPVTAVFSDDFETDLTKWDGNGATAWDLTTAQKHAGLQSVLASDGNEGDIITDDIDTSDATFINVSFWFRDDDLDSGDIDLYFFNGTTYNRADTNQLIGTNATEDTWVFYSAKTSNSQYFKSDFRVRFNAVLGSGENFWVDDFLVEKTTSDSDTTHPLVTINFPANTTYNTTSLPLLFNVSLNENGSVLYSLDGGVNNVTMSSANNLNFNASNESLETGSYTFRVYANDTAGNRNYTESTTFSFEIENYTVDGTIVDAAGAEINTTLVFNDFDTGETLYNETGTNHTGIEIPSGDYNITIIPIDISVVESLQIDGADINFDVPAIVSLDEPSDGGNFDHIFAVDLSFENFTTSSLTFIAVSKLLYKCPNWNFTLRDCPENNWTVLMSDLIPGQTYDIAISSGDPGYGFINITDAAHLDENYTFISDIFPQVSVLDNVWSEPISDGHYVRVTFERNLTSENDITIYPRNVSGAPRIEVYEKNKTTLLAEFTNPLDNQYNTIYLLNLTGSQDTFDLRILNGSVEVDHIIDPSTAFLINADASTTATGTSTGNANAGKNIVRLNSNMLVALWEDAGNDASCSDSTDEGITWSTYSSLTGGHGDMAIATNGTAIIYVFTDEGSAADISYIYNVTAECNVADSGALIDVSGGTNDNYRADVAFDGTTASGRFLVCSMDNDDFDLDFSFTDLGATLAFTTRAAVGGASTIDSCSLDMRSNGNVFVAADNKTGLIVFNASGSFNAGFSNITAYGGNVSNMHLSIRGTQILITAIDEFTSDLVVINSSNGMNYSNATYVGTFRDAEGCLDANNNSHIVFGNNTAIDYIRYSAAGGLFSGQEQIADNTGALLFPSVRCSNYPVNNQLGSSELEIVYTDDATDVYFANISIDTSVFVDRDYPIFSGFTETPVNNTAYVSGAAYEFNATITNTNATGYIKFDSVNTSATNLSTVFNASISGLSAGDHYYNWSAYGNGTFHNFNMSNTRQYFIAKAASQVNLTFDSVEGNKSVSTGATVLLNGSRITGDSTGNLLLYNDGILINNGTTPSISNSTEFPLAGFFNITVFYVASQNFTGSFKTYWINVTAAGNVAPTNPTPEINSTLGTNRTTEDLHCFDTLTDPDGDKTNVTVQWHMNSIFNLTLDYNNSYADNSFFDAVLDDANTTKSQNWSCGLRLFDGALYSGWVNSSNLTILNTAPPTPTLLSPANSASTTDRTPVFSWLQGTNDADGDALTYDLNLTCYNTAGGGCTAYGDDNRYVTGISTPYEITGDLKYISDNNFYYNWSVRADDGEAKSGWTGERNLSITALVQATLLNDSVNFGSLAYLGANDTTDNFPLPFLLENNGNVFVNVTLGAEDLWTIAANPTQYFQYKISNYSMENNSFNALFSVVTFTSVPSSGSPVLAIALFNYTNATDSVEIDINVTVPDNEPPGAKGSIVTFTASLAE